MPNSAPTHTVIAQPARNQSFQWLGIAAQSPSLDEQAYTARASLRGSSNTKNKRHARLKKLIPVLRRKHMVFNKEVAGTLPHSLTAPHVSHAPHKPLASFCHFDRTGLLLHHRAHGYFLFASGPSELVSKLQLGHDWDTAG